MCVVMLLAIAVEADFARQGLQRASISRPDTAAPRPTTTLGLDNLVAFAGLFGVVRHFAPTEAVRTTNWDDFAIRGVRAIESARNPEELAKRLQALFSPVAATVRVAVTTGGLPLDAGTGVTPSSIAVATWVNAGIGTSGCDPSLTFSSQIVVRPASRGLVPPGTPAPSRPWRSSLGGGVSASVPLAQWVALPVEEASRCLKVQPAAPAERASVTDRATRLAGVVIAWNVLRHSAPTFGVVDWTGALRRALASAAADSTPGDFQATLELLVAALQDGQAQVSGARTTGITASLPVRFDWVEGRLVVDVVAPATLMLRRGDVVTTLNGVVAEEVLASRERRISAATPQYHRYRAVSDLPIGPIRSAVTLGVRPAAGGVDREVRLFHDGPLPQLPRPGKIAELRPGVVYMDLSRTTSTDFIAALPVLGAAQGIVFDMRGDSRIDVRDLLPWLSTREVRLELAARAGATSTFRAGIPMASQPFLDEAVWFIPPPVLLRPTPPHIAAKAAFLTGPGAIGDAETILAAVEQNNLGVIVGSSTAGSHGSLNSVAIPGGITIKFTALRTTKPDGSPYLGVGVRPSVQAPRTLAGVVEGRDEVLEAGIAVVSQMQSRR